MMRRQAEKSILLGLNSMLNQFIKETSMAPVQVMVGIYCQVWPHWSKVESTCFNNDVVCIQSVFDHTPTPQDWGERRVTIISTFSG